MRGLLYIIVLLIAAGCSSSGGGCRAIDEAGRLMESDPGAALTALNAVDVAAITDSATLAQWALLYSEAMVANRLAAPTDTIIDIAVDYYGAHRRADEYRRASRVKALIHSAATADDALATALYLQKEREFFLYRERMRRQWLTAVGLVALIIAAGVIVWMRQRMKLQSARADALMAEASGLRCRLEAGREDVGRLESKLHGLLENRFALIDSLCQTYYETQGTKTERKAIADKVKSEIEAVRTDSFADIERAVNDCRDNLLGRVTELYPDIKPSDYQLLVYLAGGLSSRTVSLLLDETVEVVYKRKSRLKSRLRELVAPTFPAVMDIF